MSLLPGGSTGAEGVARAGVLAELAGRGELSTPSIRLVVGGGGAMAASTCSFVGHHACRT